MEATDPYTDRSGDLEWLDATKKDGTPLDDADVPILDEPPFVTQVRGMEGGPYLITPDSGVQVPTDFYAHTSRKSIRRAAATFLNKRPSRPIAPDGRAIIPADVREFLESGGPAAQKALTALERGLDAGSPEFKRGVAARLRKAGLD